MLLQYRQPRAFTILELIVALAVTVLMMVMINALFQATSDGVSVGIALSDVIGAGRAIGDQIERDASEMVGPIEGAPGQGVLVIVCQRSLDHPYLERRREKRRSVRMDQVMWIRRLGLSANGHGSFPVTPLSNDTFSSATKSQLADAQAIRVWYGHVKKTAGDGADGPAFKAIGPNNFANEMALGRHALYLLGSTTPPNFNHATGVAANAPVSNHVTRPGGGSSQLYHGITDISNITHMGNPAVAPGALVATGTAAAVGEYSPNTLWSGDNFAAYKDRALAMMFLDNQRLWANPFPQTVAGNTSTWMTAGQVAQMHPLMMGNVSDFIVEFAADAVIDASVTTKDVDGFDGGPDVFQAGSTTVGETIWYGLEANDSTNSAGPPNWDTTRAPGLDSPVVTSGVPGGGVAYVFRHGQGYEKFWPYMIRIRYRVQDNRGELLGDPSREKNDDSNVGKWFEQIIKVKRS